MDMTEHHFDEEERKLEAISAGFIFFTYSLMHPYKHGMMLLMFMLLISFVSPTTPFRLLPLAIFVNRKMNKKVSEKKISV